jgi:AraC-like DNA-binding protein
MGSTYREITPSPNLAAFIECFWTGDVVEDFSARVVPDGCADIIFFTRKGELIDTQVVGVMTRPHVVPLTAGTSLLGVRFHPGMAGACLRCDIQALNDRSVPIQSVCGSAGNDLVRRVCGHSSVEPRIAALEGWLTGLPTITQVQKAIGELVGRKGQLSVDGFAAVAGISERQLRRTCLKNSGLAPKQLACILRFRHAIARLRNGESDMANLALDCGYYDQAHMIRDFRDLAGISPVRCLRQHSDDRFVQYVDESPA